jgi:hypothetical protein
MFSIFWSITTLLASDVYVQSQQNSKYFFAFFSSTVTEFFKTLTMTIHIYNDFTLLAFLRTVGVGRSVLQSCLNRNGKAYIKMFQRRSVATMSPTICEPVLVKKFDVIN